MTRTLEGITNDIAKVREEAMEGFYRVKAEREKRTGTVDLKKEGKINRQLAGKLKRLIAEQKQANLLNKLMEVGKDEEESIKWTRNR